MKDFIEKIGLFEFFAYLCPGAILLLSLGLVIPPQSDSDFPGAALLQQEFLQQEFLVVVFIFIFCYSLGLIVASWSGRGAEAYYRKETSGPRKKWNPLYWLLRASFGFAVRDRQASVDARVRIYEALPESQAEDLKTICLPWDFLFFVRMMMAEKISDKKKSLLAEADFIHKRFLFCQGVAFAFLLSAFLAFVRLAVAQFQARTFSFLLEPFWAALFLFGVFASWGLRSAAGYWWGLEVILTSKLVAHEADPNIEARARE